MTHTPSFRAGAADARGGKGPADMRNAPAAIREAYYAGYNWKK